MNEQLKLKQMVDKSFPETNVKQTELATVSSSLKQEPPSKKEKFLQILKFLSPFILLAVCLLTFGGIYFAVEHDCEANYVCPKSTFKVLYTGNETEVINSSVRTKFEAYIERNYSNIFPRTDYWEAIHFVVISVTTIGYGDIVPCTWKGRLVSIVACIVGIPITLSALASLGQIFGRLLHRIWAKMYRIVKKPPYDRRRQTRLDDPQYVPLLFGLVVTLLWILLCATYFYITLRPVYRHRKPFTFFTSFYFTMVTFMTIGYGEFAPIEYDMIFPNLVLVLVGLSLVGMCIRLFQVQIETVVNDLVDMIDKEWTETMEDDDKTMSDDKRIAVKTLLDETKKSSDLITKLAVTTMGKADQKRLQHIYEDKAKNVFSVLVQATPEVRHIQIQQPAGNGFYAKSFLSTMDNECQVNLDDDNSLQNFSTLFDKTDDIKVEDLHNST